MVQFFTDYTKLNLKTLFIQLQLEH